MGGGLTGDLQPEPADEVSNPLGWEGDPWSGPYQSDAKYVSNPLGWEGDAVPMQITAGQAFVSNPLGWEGDLIHANIQRVIDKFLIH